MPTIVNAQQAAARQGRGWTRTPVVWLEPGDRFQLEAGASGLEVLEAAAPARAG
jgi:hypothetical protein